MAMRRYSDATSRELGELRSLIDPINSTIQPSIVHLWFNANGAAAFLATRHCALARLFPMDGPGFWALSARGRIPPRELAQINSLMRAEQGAGARPEVHAARPLLKWRADSRHATANLCDSNPNPLDMPNTTTTLHTRFAWRGPISRRSEGS